MYNKLKKNKGVAMLRVIFLFLSVFIFLGCGSSDSTETAIGEVAKAPDVGSSVPMLAILLSYENQEISSSDSNWSEKLFGTNAHELNNYYKEVSNSQFQFAKASENSNIINDGIVSVKLPKNHPDIDIYDEELFASEVYPDFKYALILLKDTIDFSLYDKDANGHITPNELLFTFIIAGYEDAFEGEHVKNGVWAHQYCMTDANNVPILDGVSLMGCQDGGNFALFGEKHDVNTSKTHDATIGIIAHELGHSTFSLPDLYNTAGTTGGIGYFGLMGGGTWGFQEKEYPGNTPTHFCAWSKYYNGWLTPSVETGSTSLNESSSSSYNVIKIPIDSSSYYLVENRNNSGYDRGLYPLEGDFNGGMALWHINEKKLTTSYIESNTVNADTADKGVDLVEASHATLDTEPYTPGDDRALFYFENVNYFETKITYISKRGTFMTLNIK